MTMPRIGFVGMGAMGGAMAGYLVKSGYAVTGYDVSAARAEAAALAGVTLAASPAEAAAAADVVMSSLPTPAAVRDAYLGDHGVLTRVRSGATLIDLSTVDPDTWKDVARAAAARGLECLDAPVSGGPSRPAAASWSSWSVATRRCWSAAARSWPRWAARSTTWGRSAPRRW